MIFSASVSLYIHLTFHLTLFDWRFSWHPLAENSTLKRLISLLIHTPYYSPTKHLWNVQCTWFRQVDTLTVIFTYLMLIFKSNPIISVSIYCVFSVRSTTSTNIRDLSINFAINSASNEVLRIRLSSISTGS